jgi:hypothetical protein
VRPRFVVIGFTSLMLALVLPAWGQSSGGQDSSTTTKSASVHAEKKTGQGKEIGKGGEDIGKGAAKGSADLAKGGAGGVGKTWPPVTRWVPPLHWAKERANSAKMSASVPAREPPK